MSEHPVTEAPTDARTWDQRILALIDAGIDDTLIIRRGNG